MAKTSSVRLSILNLGSYSMKATIGSFDNNLFVIEGIQNVKNEAQLTSQSSFDDYMAALDRALGVLHDGVFADSSDVHLVLNPNFLMAKIIGMPEFAKSDLDAVMKDRLERDSAVSNKPNGLDDFISAHLLYDKLKEDDKVDDQSDIAVLAVLCEKAIQTSLTTMLAKHDLSLAGLWSEVVALAGLMKRHDQAAFGGSVAVVNVGHNLTTFQIFVEGRCLFFRPIYTAGQQVTKDVLAITADDTIDFKQAEELKHRMTLAPEDVDPSTLSPLEALIQTISESAALKEFSLVRKLDISFEYLSANLKKRISKVYFTGGTTNLRGFLHHIKNNTALPQGELLEIADQVKLSTSLPEDEGRDAWMNSGTAIGLAFAIKDGLMPELNLVHRRVVKFDVKDLKNWVINNKYLSTMAAEILVGLVAVGLLGSQWWDLKTKVRLWTATRNAQKKKLADYEDYQKNFYQGDAAALKKKYEDARNALVLYRAVVDQRHNWTRVLMEMANGCGSRDIALTEVTYDAGIGKEEAPLKMLAKDPPPIVVKGSAPKGDPVNELQASLKKSNAFRRVEVLRMGKAPPEAGFDGFVFEMGLVPK
ncbi:MAG: pilus assembly protein PilM [Candidatus Riflebacteria bacterium]|nr:pilus assembly protein PilM [Candidatus Riflebacteria bacterium]